MSAVTALAHLGFPHPNDQGLRPEYLFQFHEGDRPAWVMDPRTILREASEPPRPKETIVWIPTLPHMTEELVLMVGVHVLRDQELLDLFNGVGIEPTASHIELNDIPKEVHARMLEWCKSFEGSWKIALTVFEGSGLDWNFAALSSYKCQLEVCRSIFHRYHSQWTESVHVFGKLTA